MLSRTRSLSRKKFLNNTEITLQLSDPVLVDDLGLEPDHVDLLLDPRDAGGALDDVLLRVLVLLLLLLRGLGVLVEVLVGSELKNSYLKRMFSRLDR